MHVKKKTKYQVPPIIQQGTNLSRGKKHEGNIDKIFILTLLFQGEQLMVVECVQYHNHPCRKHQLRGASIGLHSKIKL